MSWLKDLLCPNCLKPQPSSLLDKAPCLPDELKEPKPSPPRPARTRRHPPQQTHYSISALPSALSASTIRTVQPEDQKKGQDGIESSPVPSNEKSEMSPTSVGAEGSRSDSLKSWVTVGTEFQSNSSGEDLTALPSVAESKDSEMQSGHHA